MRYANRNKPSLSRSTSPRKDSRSPASVLSTAAASPTPVRSALSIRIIRQIPALSVRFAGGRVRALSYPAATEVAGKYGIIAKGLTPPELHLVYSPADFGSRRDGHSGSKN